MWHVAELPQSQYALRLASLCMDTRLSTNHRDVFSTKQIPIGTNSSSHLDGNGSHLLQYGMTSKSICDVSLTLNTKNRVSAATTQVIRNERDALSMQYLMNSEPVTEHQWRT